MHKLFTILHYNTGTLQPVFSAKGQLPSALLQFISTQADKIPTGQQETFQTYYGDQEHFFSIYFAPEKKQKTSGSTIWIVVHTVDNFEANGQELPALTSEIKMFFRKGAHDMKNLLSNVSLLLRQNMVEKADVYLKEIQSSYINQIDSIYDALDTFIDIKKPNDPLVKQIRFESLLAYTATQLPTLSDNQISMTTDFQNCPVIAYRDDFLQNIMTSLLDNAVRYCADDRKLHVHLSTKRDHDAVVLSVEDNGTGIDMERFQSKLFMPFQRFTRKSNGQGISLHLIKLMVEKNGGNIAIKSDPDQGTQVILSLKEYR